MTAAPITPGRRPLGSARSPGGRPATDWSQAACRDMDTEVFFPDRSEDTLTVKAVCWDCPIRTPCLETAVGWSDMHGIWAGTTRMDRREICTGRMSHADIIARDRARKAARDERSRQAARLADDPPSTWDEGRKWCPSCEVWLLPTAFYSDRSRSDGLSGLCGPCHQRRQRQYKARRVAA